MRIFLIRHGETVDNVAQVYAGSRDSELTNHGFNQATYLARYLRDKGLSFTHLFASPLQRALKTAQLIRDGQAAPEDPHPAPKQPLAITSLSVLKEQDFGSQEGKPWRDRPNGSDKVGKQPYQETQKDDPESVDVESKESMAQRMDEFLDEHIAPLWQSASEPDEHIVAIVSHGIILSVLWRRILRRLPPYSISFDREITVERRSSSLENICGFSNTGYLELVMTAGESLARVPTESNDEKQPTNTNDAGESENSTSDLPQAPVRSPAADTEHVSTASSTTVPGAPKVLHGWVTKIKTINGQEHMKTLKRTRGGVGSSKHDEKQKTLDSFFKRRRTD
ncbi:uncharacterized protein K452DRAFT_325858 [Aplosporella prunicola CBS 121167]|uniref:Phosphoglycerate mutase-like protein n=1 Tax=Aplosporella prunicola CBS 121167 TaxID=1176127 RepID=A0A6A6BGH2_9PEZI|nr:uncharacterized protein K452DRAFT_325858 [Aplosporella prunicola CBS 121167]KAF2143260.1 hypothetical protein K452DRAFT_325858 [Aplosporella prunicola CBS 121167]